MISPERFITRSSDRDAWLAARARGVTATMVAEAATPKTFDRVAASIGKVDDIPDNPYMKFGRDNEGWIALELKRMFGIMPNEWLIASADEEFMMSTPDGLSLDHSTISEIKTTGTDWGKLDKVPARYIRQVQWQLHTTGAELCKFAYMLRVDGADGVFQPAWLEPKVFDVQRDEELITELIDTAKRLQMHSVYQSWQ